MPLPVPNLDDRRFDDLVEEARARLATHLPELAQIAPGDPLYALVDLFAWLTETILFRANLIPERQRRVFLNLLQIPVRPARPARGVVCIDATPGSLPPLLPAGSQLRAGKIALTTVGEVQPTPLSLQVLAKEKLTPADLADLNLTLNDLREQFGLTGSETPEPFRPRRFEPLRETLSLAGSLDGAFYLACLGPKQPASQLDRLRRQLAGCVLNIALAPADALDGEAVGELQPRALTFELIAPGPLGRPLFLPLEILADSSRGGRLMGVARLRLPKNAELFHALAPADPVYAGRGDAPPDLPDPADAGRVAFWLRVRCPDEPGLELGYLGINGVDVIAQGLRRDLILGLGTGQPDQSIALPDRNIAADSLLVEVEENGAFVAWSAVDFLAGQPADARVFRLDPGAGVLHFGDGIASGCRPPEGATIRAAVYRHGGGAEGNLIAGSIAESVDGGSRLRPRQDWPLSGGVDAETVSQAERRIPQFLTHRNRAVTRDDFEILAETNPVNPVARAEVIEGFLPGATLLAARQGVPGAVSVFVLPPGEPALGQTPKPSRGLLKDVFAYLLNRVLIGTELYVLSPDFVPLAVSVRVQAKDAATEQQTLRNVRDALVNYLWPLAPGGARGEGWPLGGEVRPWELLTQAARAEGVLAVNALALFRKSGSAWQRLGLEETLPLALYQLPELVGLTVAAGTGSPPLPEGLETAASPGRGVPVPAIPDRC